MIHNAGFRRAWRAPAAILVGIMVFTCLSPVRAQSPRPGLAGHYYLQGVQEVGSELLLLPNGQFRWMMSYGAVDQEEGGHWAERGERIELDPDAGGDKPLLAVQTATAWSQAASDALAATRHAADVSPAFACRNGQKGITDASDADSGWGCAIPSVGDGQAGAGIIAVRLSSPESDDMNGIGILVETSDGSQMRAISQDGWLFFPRPTNAKVVHISVLRGDMAHLVTIAPDPAMAGNAVFDLAVNVPKLEACAVLPTLMVEGHDLVMEGTNGRYVV